MLIDLSRERHCELLLLYDFPFRLLSSESMCEKKLAVPTSSLEQTKSETKSLAKASWTVSSGQVKLSGRVLEQDLTFALQLKVMTEAIKELGVWL